MAQRYCDHEFHVIEHADGGLKPATVVCLFCGQVRQLYHDGRVLITKEFGEVKKAYANGNTNNSSTAQ